MPKSLFLAWINEHGNIAGPFASGLCVLGAALVTFMRSIYQTPFEMRQAEITRRQTQHVMEMDELRVNISALQANQTAMKELNEGIAAAMKRMGDELRVATTTKADVEAQLSELRAEFEASKAQSAAIQKSMESHIRELEEQRGLLEQKIGLLKAQIESMTRQQGTNAAAITAVVARQDADDVQQATRRGRPRRTSATGDMTDAK